MRVGSCTEVLLDKLLKLYIFSMPGPEVTVRVMRFKSGIGIIAVLEEVEKLKPGHVCYVRRHIGRVSYQFIKVFSEASPPENIKLYMSMWDIGGCIPSQAP